MIFAREVVDTPGLRKTAPLCSAVACPRWRRSMGYPPLPEVSRAGRRSSARTIDVEQRVPFREERPILVRLEHLLRLFVTQLAVEHRDRLKQLGKSPRPLNVATRRGTGRLRSSASRSCCSWSSSSWETYQLRLVGSVDSNQNTSRNRASATGLPISSTKDTYSLNSGLGGASIKTTPTPEVFSTSQSRCRLIHAATMRSPKTSLSGGRGHSPWREGGQVHRGRDGGKGGADRAAAASVNWCVGVEPPNSSGAEKPGCDPVPRGCGNKLARSRLLIRSRRSSSTSTGERPARGSSLAPPAPSAR